MSAELEHILDLGNKVFTTFFALEAVLKLAALSREYFGNGWNIFDLVKWENIILIMIKISIIMIMMMIDQVIVVASLLDLGLESVDGISVLRGMRLVTIIIISIITFLIVFAVFVIIIVVISNRSIIGSDCNALITIFLQT